MWGNRADMQGDQVNLGSYCNPNFYYSLIQGGTDEFGGSAFEGEYVECIDEDPVFESGEEFPPYYPNYGSPVLNAGTPNDSEWFLEEYLPEVDLWNLPRNAFGRIDMGVYEHFAVGLPESSTYSKNMFKVYPNPVYHSANIEFELKQEGSISVLLYNSIGQQLEVLYNGDLNSGTHTLTFTLNHLSNGIYFIKFQSGTTITTTKLLKN